MSNSIEGSSESLVIAEGVQQISINSSDEKGKNDDDLFELSNDQPSVSFQIEQGQKLMKIKQLCRKSKDDTIQIKVIDQPPPQENKRKRKEIFDRFKKEKSVINKVQESKGSDNLLNIFDSIFSKKNDGPAGFCGVFDSSASRDQNRPILEGISIRSRTPSAQKRRLKIFTKKKTAETYESVLPQNILQDNKTQNNNQINKFQQKAEIFSPVRDYRRDDSLNFQTIQKRISLIQARDHQISRDSFEINNILQSQIFKDQKVIEVPQLPLQEREPQKQMLMKENSIISQLHHQDINEKPKEIEEVMGQSKPTALKISPSSNQQNVFRKKQPVPLQVFQAGKMEESQIISQVPNTDSVATVIREQQKPFIQGLPIDETKYLVNSGNDTSSISSTPSVYIQNYDSRKVLLNEYNSMANIPKRNYEELSTPRMSELKNTQFQQYSQAPLVESRVLENIQRINIAHCFEEEQRLPIFLRKARKLISVYPNFHILSNNPNTPEVVIQQFYTLIEELKKSVQFLCDMCQKLLDMKAKKQLYLEQIMTNLSVQAFLDVHWEQINQVSETEALKPIEPIDIRAWNYEKAKTALTNYENVINHYGVKGLKLDLSTEKGRKKYFDIRHKFWDICGNMKLIGQDIYYQIKNSTIPKHYSDFKQFLSEPFPNKLSQKDLQKTKKLLNTYRHLKNEKDQLINSAIGLKIKEKLQLRMRYLNPY